MTLAYSIKLPWEPNPFETMVHFKLSKQASPHHINNMTDPLRYIGRIGKPKNDVASGSYVRVDSYDPEAAEYCVKMLSELDEDIYRVKVADIVFQTTPEFVDKFPNPPHFMIQGNLDMKNIPSGSIVDFTECTTDPIVDCGKLFVRGSYRFLGKRSKTRKGRTVLTCLPYCVFVGAQNEDDIIEFENIFFDTSEGSHNVVCLRGNIVFRGCGFRGVENGFKVGSGNAQVNVLFEGGTVYYEGQCGVAIDANAQLTMRDVAIGGTGVGVSVIGGGNLILDDCNINANAFGVVMSGEESITEMTRCAFRSNKRCSVMADGGTLTMTDCVIEGPAECGVIVVDQMGSVSTAAILQCTRISECGCGVRISGVGTCSSSQLAITSCTIGVYLTGTSTGEVSLDGLKHLDNVINVVNLCVERDQLTTDSVRQPSKDLLQRLQDVQDIVAAMPNDLVDKVSRALSTVWSLKAKRLMARLGMHLPLPEDIRSTKVRHCHHCDMLETSTPNVSFKKCNRCLRVCYCSKDCQTMHWGHHKFECNLPNKWHKELWRMEHVICVLCQKIFHKVDEEAEFKRHFIVCHTCTINRSKEVAR